MRPPSGKRPTLKSRCWPSSGLPDERLLRRLRHEIGGTQLREILLGVTDRDEDWRRLCQDLLEAQLSTLGEKLAGKLTDAYRELRYPSPASDRRDALLAGYEWTAERRRHELGHVIAQRVAREELSLAEADLLLTRDEWHRVAVAAVGYLVRGKHAAGLTDCRLWLLHGSDRAAAAVAAQLSGSAEGFRVLRSAIAEMSGERLLAVLRAVGRKRHRQLRSTAARRVLDLSVEADGATPPLVEAAGLCLPQEEVAAWCLSWMGPFRPDHPVVTAAAQHLQHRDESVRSHIMSYVEKLLLLERELGSRDRLLAGQPLLTRAVMQQAYVRLLAQTPDVRWSIHQVLHHLACGLTANPESRDLVVTTIRTYDDRIARDVVHLLLPALSERLLCLFDRAVPLLPTEVATLLWVGGLKAHSEAIRRACITQLQALGRQALSHSLQALQRDPQLAGPVMHVLQRLPRLTGDDVEACWRAWDAARGEAKAALTILLADCDPAGLAPRLPSLLRSPEAVVRGAGAFSAPMAGGAEALPGLCCLLLDPHLEVAGTARRALIRWPARVAVQPLLARMLVSRSGALQVQGLWIVGEGQHGALIPWIRRLVDQGVFEPSHLAWLEARLRDDPAPSVSGFPQFEYSRFRLPVRLSRWRQYWHQVRRSLDLTKAFRQASFIGVIPDATYLQVRNAAVRGAAGSLALYSDLVDDLFTGARQSFEAYHGVEVSAEDWRTATEAALRSVDERYLLEQWERGRPQLAINDAAASQWEAALWWEIETLLLGALPRHHAGPCPPGFPAPEWGGRIEREWHWLSQFSHWHWGFTVRPRVPLGDLVVFVRRNWRKVSDQPEMPKAQVVREILDYCALWGHAFPGNKAWRQELREALWECHTPLRQAILRREQGDGRDRSRGGPAETSEQALEYHFRQALEEWEPFHGSPEEPPIPIGLLGARVGRKPLPPEVYGRGVPFTHYLKRRLKALWGDARSFDVLQDDLERTAAGGDHEAEDDDDLGEGTAVDDERESDEGDEDHFGTAHLQARTSPRPQAGWWRHIIIDDQGRKWLPLKGGLDEKARVHYKQLLGERNRGFLRPECRRRRLVVPVDDRLDDLCAELQRRSVLRRLKHFAREAGVPPDELRRVVARRQHC